MGGGGIKLLESRHTFECSLFSKLSWILVFSLWPTSFDCYSGWIDIDQIRLVGESGVRI